jgi:hypothetical protein
MLIEGDHRGGRPPLICQVSDPADQLAMAQVDPVEGSNGGHTTTGEWASVTWLAKDLHRLEANVTRASGRLPA